MRRRVGRPGARGEYAKRPRGLQSPRQQCGQQARHAGTGRGDVGEHLVEGDDLVRIGAGTGSEFSPLPAQNANGNWVKVTQRVPVRLCFDEKPTRQMIAVLSTDVEVDLGGK